MGPRAKIARRARRLHARSSRLIGRAIGLHEIRLIERRSS